MTCAVMVWSCSPAGHIHVGYLLSGIGAVAAAICACVLRLHVAAADLRCVTRSQDQPSSSRAEKRNRKILIVIPGPFAPKDISIYVEETCKAIAFAQTEAGALEVQDLQEHRSPTGQKCWERRDIRHKVRQYSASVLTCRS